MTVTNHHSGHTSTVEDVEAEVQVLSEHRKGAKARSVWKVEEEGE